MESLAKVLVSLREKKVENAQVIYLPVSFSESNPQSKVSFFNYMRVARNIICL